MSLLALAAAVSVALAAGPEQVDAGDAAWAAGDRPLARRLWREAAASADPAVVAMAELRLLRVGGNLGMAVHGPRADAALARCAPERPWCQLAAADRILTARELGLPSPGRPEDHAQAALLALPGPATARLVWAGRAPVEALDDHDSGGLGAVLRRGQGAWTGPGTWVAGLLIAGGSGQGAVLGVRLDHPDLGLQGHRLHLRTYGTTRGGGGAAVVFRGAGRVSGLAETSLQRAILDVYNTAGARRSVVADGGAASGGLVWRPRQLTVDLTADARADRVGGQAWAAAGPSTALWWRPQRELRLGAHAGQLLGATRQSRLGAELRRSPAAGLATRVLVDASLQERALPVWWRPSAGGGEVLRHGGLGRYRGPLLSAAVVEWRQPVVGPLDVVGFAEGAWIDDWHGGLGGGLRLDLPPRPSNRLRFDVAWGDGGLGVSAGLGQAF